MAKLIGCNLSGALGPVVLCTWKGKPYVRARPAHVRDAKSAAQLGQRSKLAQCHRFVQQVLPVVRIGYAAFSQQMAPYNACMSQLMRQACTGVYPDTRLELKRAVLGQGTLRVAKGVRVEVTAQGLLVKWQSLPESATAMASDRVICTIYNADRVAAVHSIAGYRRGDGACLVALPDDWQGEQLHCFLGFQSASLTEVSNIVQVAAFVLGADGAALPQLSQFLNSEPKLTAIAVGANAGVESG